MEPGSALTRQAVGVTARFSECPGKSYSPSGRRNWREYLRNVFDSSRSCVWNNAITPSQALHCKPRPRLCSCDATSTTLWNCAGPSSIKWLKNKKNRMRPENCEKTTDISRFYPIFSKISMVLRRMTRSENLIRRLKTAILDNRFRLPVHPVIRIIGLFAGDLRYPPGSIFTFFGTPAAIDIQ